MKIEQQVASLELSKRLKELGVKQSSHFAWNLSTAPPRLQCTQGTLGMLELAAFTVAELGEMLPAHVERFTPNGERFSSQMTFWNLSYKHCGRIGVWQDEVACLDFEDGGEKGSEANLRAKMLIYLLENNFISL